MKLDIGCGTRKKDGFTGVDSIAFEGVDVVADLKARWPFEDSSVDEVHASHVIEHFTGVERIHIVNELYRVMKPGAKATIITPHWSSCRAYGDPTHCWPPVSEFWFYYLDKKWRASQAPHTDAEHMAGGYACDFEATWGYGIHREVELRAKDFQDFAVQFYKEAVQDIHATLTRR